MVIGDNCMDSIIKDIRFAIRKLLQRPGFTLIAVLTLGLGIGATTAIFIVDRTVLRPQSGVGSLNSFLVQNLMAEIPNGSPSVVTTRLECMRMPHVV